MKSISEFQIYGSGLTLCLNITYTGAKAEKEGFSMNGLNIKYFFYKFRRDSYESREKTQNEEARTQTFDRI